MKFKPGHAKIPGSGRPKGSKSKPQKYNLQRALAAKSIDPLLELIKVLPLVDPQQQVNVWTKIVLALHGRPREAKPGDDAIEVESPTEVQPTSANELIDLLKVVSPSDSDPSSKQ